MADRAVDLEYGVVGEEPLEQLGNAFIARSRQVASHDREEFRRECLKPGKTEPAVDASGDHPRRRHLAERPDDAVKVSAVPSFFEWRMQGLADQEIEHQTENGLGWVRLVKGIPAVSQRFPPQRQNCSLCGPG